MAICVNNRRKQYFISYKDLDPETGEYKTFNITNAKWTLDKGKRYMRSIEAAEIEADRKRRKRKPKRGTADTLNDLLDLYCETLSASYKPQTAYAAKIVVDKYIRELFLSTRTLSEAITIQTVEKYRNSILALHLSQKRSNDLIRGLKYFLKWARRRDYIVSDLADKLDGILETVRGSKSIKEKLCFWTNEEWDKFYASFEENDPFRMLFETDYKCALRIGEILGLKWSDFDYERRRISIVRSVDNFGNLTTPKNASSESTVSISKDFANVLLQFKKDTAGDDEDWMFFAGHRTSRTTIKRVMAEHIAKAGIPYIKFHGLRHSCASRMINAGCSVLLVSKHLRHASTQQTLDTYSHLFPTDTDALMVKVFG